MLRPYNNAEKQYNSHGPKAYRASRMAWLSRLRRTGLQRHAVLHSLAAQYSFYTSIFLQFSSFLKFSWYTCFVCFFCFHRAMLCIRGTSHGPVSVRPSVCPSQVGLLLKRLNVGSHKQHHTIPQGLQFSDAKNLCEIRPGSPPAGAPNAGGVGKNRRISTNSWLYLENGTRQTHGFY